MDTFLIMPAFVNGLPAPIRRTAREIFRWVTLLGGPMMVPILFGGLVLVTAGLSCLWFTRRQKQLPGKVIDAIHRIAKGLIPDPKIVRELVRDNSSLLGRLLAEAVGCSGRSASEITQALGSSAGRELLRIRRSFIPIQLCARIAPLAGLLGAILGMVDSFGKIGGSNAPEKSAQLASGISAALMVTFGGILLALAAESLVHFLRHRLEGIAIATHELLVPLPEKLAALPRATFSELDSTQGF